MKRINNLVFVCLLLILIGCTNKFDNKSIKLNEENYKSYLNVEIQRPHFSESKTKSRIVITPKEDKYVFKDCIFDLEEIYNVVFEVDYQQTEVKDLLVTVPNISIPIDGHLNYEYKAKDLIFEKIKPKYLVLQRYANGNSIIKYGGCKEYKLNWISGTVSLNELYK